MNFWYTKIKDNIPTAVTFNCKDNKNYILTILDPLSRWKVSMIADLVEWVRVVSMFICNMSQEWIPLSQDEADKTRFGRCSTPIKVSTNSFSLLAASSFLVTDRATCQMSEKWVVPGQFSLIHLAIPLWRSEINTPILTPSRCRKPKHRFTPSSSVW